MTAQSAEWEEPNVRRFDLSTPRGEHMAGHWSVTFGIVAKADGEYVSHADYVNLARRTNRLERLLNGFVINEQHMDDQEFRSVRDKLFLLARSEIEDGE